MIEANPHRRIARVFAFICYVVAGLLACVSVFFILPAAYMDLSQIRGVEGVTNARMTVMVGSMFTIWVLMIALLGWRIQRVFGQHLRIEKPVATGSVGCLRLGSLGCGLWAITTALGVIFTGQILATGEPAGIQDLFVGASGFIIAVTLMLSMAWCSSANFVRLNEQERKRAYQAYLYVVQANLPGVADPEIRAHLQEQTFGVLPKLDQSLKGTLLEHLSKSKLLSGGTRIVLRNADFRGAD